jgi:putative phosphoribosyl transferase
MFQNRADAGAQLAKKLLRYKGTRAVVLALPRGGVVTGYEIAKALSLPLDIVAVRKIGHPASPEYAIGAVNENGAIILNETEAAAVDRRWLADETKRQQEEAKRRSVAYRAGRVPLILAGTTAILVDDGVATGLTMRLAIRSVKVHKPARVVVAIPVAPPGMARVLKAEGADDILVLEPPEDFMGAVGAHYTRFEQVEDDEVIRLMRSARDFSK